MRGGGYSLATARLTAFAWSSSVFSLPKDPPARYSEWASDHLRGDAPQRLTNAPLAVGEGAKLQPPTEPRSHDDIPHRKPGNLRFDADVTGTR